MCLEDIKGFSQPWKSSILARNVSIVNLLNLSFQDKFDIIAIFQNFLGTFTYIYICEKTGRGGILKFLSIPCRTKEPLFMVGSWWRAEGNTGKELGEIRERAWGNTGKRFGKEIGEIRERRLVKYWKGGLGRRRVTQRKKTGGMCLHRQVSKIQRAG